MSNRTCAVEVCDRKVEAREWCVPHYKRWKRTGSTGNDPIRARRSGCEVTDCDAPHFGHGMCRTHLYRLRSNGDPLTTRPPGSPAGETNPHWRGEDVAYSAVHRRLRELVGPASRFSCAACDAPAQEWAYQHDADDERICQKSGLPFTTDLTHYQPMCRSCHRAFDARFGWHDRRQGRGVSWHRQVKKWRAYAFHGGKQWSGGCYDTREEAEQAASQLRHELLTEWQRAG